MVRVIIIKINRKRIINKYKNKDLKRKEKHKFQ
jgi:hypothetical protein